ncbi:MAG: peptide chain release factor 2 [Bacilli bacterium]
MDLYSIEQGYQKINNKFQDLISIKTLDSLKASIKEVETAMLKADFYLDKSNVKKQTSILSQAKNTINEHEGLTINLELIKEYLSLLKEEEDESLYDEVYTLLQETTSLYQALETKLLLDEEYDSGNAILEIHSGAGGTESQDWVLMLYKMYVAYAKRNGFKIDLLYLNKAIDVGYKNVTIKISGLNAYGLLKNEKGVHRLVRISPFDSSAKRHTTFASVSIAPEIESDNEIIIDEKDLEIDTYRSSGAGGQSVNTTDSAVRITHIPTKIVVSMQNERSQIQNRAIALTILKAKLLELKIANDKEQLALLKGANNAVDFGSQIRSYVFHPYAMVKDHRSNFESSNPNEIIEGKLDDLINSVLRMSKER